MKYSLKYLIVSPLFVVVFLTMLMFSVNLFVLDENWGWGHNVYLLGVLCFSVSYTVTLASFTLVGLSKRGGKVNKPYTLVVRLYWGLAIIGLVLSVYKIYRFGILGAQDQVLLNLRIANTWEGQPSYGAQHFSLFALCLALYYTQQRRALYCILAAIIYLISALSMAERTTILFLFVAVSYMAVDIGWVKLKGLLVFLAILIFLLIAVAVGTGKTGGENPYDFIFSYFGYAVTALSQWIEGRELSGCASLVYGKLITVFSLGLYSCVDIDLGFGESDFNVLTYASAPYLYGGLIAVVLSMTGCGLVFAVLRVLATRSPGYFLALLSCYMYALVMMFYAWQFSLTTYLYLVVALFPVFAGRFLSGGNITYRTNIVRA
ncbi:oligosaccharide repeat unit polymerase [Pseudomonas sp. D2-30]|uniref:oligosaccharide repeat unit polymerase n=1 Tax=unclassified Pseudomonas TaxID=196821 RepID=UPI003DA7C42A